MTLLQHHFFALALTTAFSFSLGVFVWMKNPHRWLNRLFALHSFAIAGWSAIEPFSTLFASSESVGMFWLRIEHLAVFMLPPLVFHLVAELLELRRADRFIRAGYLLSATLTCGIFSPLLLSRQVPKAYVPLWLVPGPLYHGFLTFFWIYVGASLYCLWRGYRTSTGTRRLQIKYFFIASLLGYLGGGSDFLLVYDIYIPWLSPYALYLVPIYKLITAYVIVQHHFLDIHIVIRKSLVYSILVTLLTVGYFGLVYGVERAFQTTFGYQSVWVSLAAFALMALAFQPLKVGIQRLVDWVIFRAPHEELVRRMERLEQEALQTEKFRAVSTLAAGMAHEIKNPLTAIKTFAEFIPEKQKDPEFLKKLHEILTTETCRIQEIVQDLLNFSKPKPPQMKLVDPGPLVDSTVHLLSGDLMKQRIRWTIDCRHNGASVLLDPDQFRQVLINLIQNAAEAMPEGGALTLTTRTLDGHLELTLSDTGTGIPKELLPKIFDPFVTTKGHGTGLGLAVVYSIIQAHRGTIRAESIPGKGTAFTVKLPL